MKKILLAAFVAVASLSANAQVWVGGNLGLSTSKTSYDGTTRSKDNAVTIAPEIGYKYSDNLDFAVKLEYSHTDGEGEASTNGFSINPYVRYTCFTSGKFSVFVDGGFSYEMSHESGVEKNKNTWGIGIKPGIAYSLTDKVGLVAHIGKGLGWEYINQGDEKTNKFGLDLTNRVTFGVYVNL